ncbi:expressed unknown protein [Seminavis robusta]|uniref:DOMON domain-containing protein n=1 Tax=Seminavis robusta TaxID=568900 RepID=A0A9N8ELC5_9STRA|nr:expressed unknown protein [Seminavis robusta]|eukprot:Sro1304_g261080.1 n/a (579) ;mRNA; r:16725-18461
MTTTKVFVAIASVLALSLPALSLEENTEAPLWLDEENISPGKVICRAGYVMDAYRIQDGFLVTRPDVKALEGPNLYAVSSLVDLPEAISSTFHILEAPGNAEPLFRPGWGVTDNQPLIDLARSVGDCASCSGGSTSVGFRAEVEGTVVRTNPQILEINKVRLAVRGEECAAFYTESPSASPTRAPTGTPTIRAPTPAPTTRRSLSPSGAPSLAPTRSPSSAPSATPSQAPSMTPSTVPSFAPSSMPSLRPSAAPSGAPAPIDCSGYQKTFQVPELPVVIHHVVNIDEADSSMSTLSAQVVYEGQGWLGFGISPNGGMNGSNVVIGTAGSGDNLLLNPGKYYLGGHSEEFVSLIDKQTLLDESITQNETHTVLSFTKYLEEEGEATINGNGTNRFVVAYGFDNLFSFHEQRASFVMTLSPCIPEEIEHIVNVTANYTEEVPFPEIEDIDIDGEENPNAIPFDGENDPELDITILGGSERPDDGENDPELDITTGGSQQPGDGENEPPVLEPGFEQDTEVAASKVGRISNKQGSDDQKPKAPADAYAAAAQFEGSDEASSAMVTRISMVVVGLTGMLIML